ncbi:MAG TPA: amidohydrolase family protein [Rhodothermales bacterium]|nr:amidohydrolase family protein [Rhodothermales bacterium]
MSRFLLLLVFACLLISLPVQAQRTLVHCGTLLDPGVSDAPMTERTVVIEGERVVSVEEGFTSAGAGDGVIDLRDQFCMPGLTDMHTHLTGESRKGGYIDRFRYTPAVQALQATQYARTTLLSGFTTVRDVGGGEGVDYALRDAIASGWIAGPRMFVAGKSLAVMGGHADPTNGYREDILGIPGPEEGIADGVEDAVKATRLAIKRGSDLIKITATGGVLSIASDGSGAHFKEEEIRAIVETARDHGRKVTAHAHGDEGMQRAIRAGIASIEHGTYMSDETMEMMKEHGVYLVPTITAGKSVADSARIENYYVPVVTKKALEVGPVIQGTFAKAYQAGVPIAFGTDAGVFKHGRNWKEFTYMVEAGMPPMEAIKAATVSAADLLGQSDNLGTLEPGKYADLIAVPRNPLDDINVMGEVSFVMKAGTVYKQDGMPMEVIAPRQ